MGTPVERRQREKQEVRERILEAARELFVAQGYEAVTMRQIAHKIEYTPTAIYFHFKDKEHLISELCAIDFLKMARTFNHLSGIKDPAERLCRMAIEYMEFGLKHPNHYRLLFMTPHPHIPPEDIVLIRRGNPAEDAYAFLRANIIECIAAGKFRPEYRDPEIVAQVLWSSIHGVTSLHIARHQDPWIPWRPVRKIAEEMLAITMRGLTGREQEPREVVKGGKQIRGKAARQKRKKR